MSAKKPVKRFYYKRSFRITSGVLVVVMFFTMVIQPQILIAISRSSDSSEAAVNYLVDSTEYVNKNTPQRVAEYLGTLTARETVEDYYRLASMQIAREEYTDALENIEKCLSLYDEAANELYLDLLLKRGCLQVMLEEYDAALNSLDLALAADPEASDIYLVKAQIYAERKNMKALTQCLQRYLKLVPEDSSVRELLAQAQFAQGDHQAAAKQYQEILQTQPTAEIQYLSGLNAVKNSDFTAAESSLSSAIAQDDSYDGIYYYRGVARMSLKNYPAAIEDLTVSIARADMLQASYYTRGICLLMNRELEKGLADIQYAAALHEDEAIASQAQQLLAELAAAPPDDTGQLGETILPGESVIPGEEVPTETVQPGDELPVDEVLIMENIQPAAQ